jgi:phosphoribosylformylglycinamidine synthase
VKAVRALVLTGFGINCQDEMAAAYRLAGAEADVVHFNEWLAGTVSLRGYDVLNFPGGFSFGDDLGAGKALANKMRFCRLAGGRTLLDEIADHLAAAASCWGFATASRSW